MSEMNRSRTAGRIADTLELLRDHPNVGVTLRMLMEATGYGRRQALGLVAVLECRDILERRYKVQPGHEQRYRLTARWQPASNQS